MSVETRHPEVTADRASEWRLMQDAMTGESAVKAAGETYLPKPGGFRAQDDNGAAMYVAYRGRAQFPEILAPSVGAMVGIIHGREIKIDMPEPMAGLWEDADGDGLPLEAFHRRITRHLLVTGRYGVLADVPEAGGEPFLKGYAASAIINWDRDWFVLDESGMVRSGFAWSEAKRHRVLSMEGGAYIQTLWEGGAAREIPVRLRGGGMVPRVPFAVANATDLSPRIQTPPLIGVARASVAIYQLSADYRWQLFMSGQETLVAINGDAPKAVGAGVVHVMEGDGDQAPDLKYVSPTCAGITAHKEAMEDCRRAAVAAGARMLEQSEQAQESGTARRLRFASETATLTSIAQVSCALLERSLRNVAMFMGLNEDDVVVTPPTDLLDNTMTPQDFAALFGVYTQGGISWPTLFELGQRGGIYSAEIDADAEYARINPTGDLDVDAA